MREEQSRAQRRCVSGTGEEEGKERALKIEHGFLLKNSAAASRCGCRANRFFLGVVTPCLCHQHHGEPKRLTSHYIKPSLPSFTPPPLRGSVEHIRSSRQPPLRQWGTSEVEWRIWTQAKWSALTVMTYGTG